MTFCRLRSLPIVKRHLRSLPIVKQTTILNLISSTSRDEYIGFNSNRPFLFYQCINFLKNFPNEVIQALIFTDFV